MVALSRGGSAAVYSAPATVTPTSIEADLGGLGQISVNFVASGTTTRHSICGVPHTFESGTYEGEVEFNGENGYTDVTATSVSALIGPITNFLCVVDGPLETWGPHTPGARLDVRASKSRGGFLLEVNKNHPKSRVSFYATTEERQGAISITRTVEGTAAPGAFTFDPRLQRATLTLPAPFAGHAEFHRAAPPGHRWSGSLSVDFPGRPHMRLTGASARAELVHREISR